MKRWIWLALLCVLTLPLPVLAAGSGWEILYEGEKGWLLKRSTGTTVDEFVAINGGLVTPGDVIAAQVIFIGETESKPSATFTSVTTLNFLGGGGDGTVHLFRASEDPIPQETNEILNKLRTELRRNAPEKESIERYMFFLLIPRASLKPDPKEWYGPSSTMWFLGTWFRTNYSAITNSIKTAYN